jgi:5'-nucleotidase
VIRTLQNWGVRLDEAFFLGGMDKSQVLKAFGAHIFFDDNADNTAKASQVVLAAQVPSVDFTKGVAKLPA